MSLKHSVRTATNVRAASNTALTAQFELNTFNREERTIEVVFGTDTPVLMYGYDRFYEILSFEDGHVRWARINSGAPMLDQHNRWRSVTEQPGVIVRAWTDDKKRGRALLKFSKLKEGSDLMEQVADGIVRNVSVGYTVFEYEEVSAAGSQSQGAARNNSIPTYRALDWEPYEISFVSVPADYLAGVRGAGDGGENRSEPPNPATAYEIPVRNIDNNDTTTDNNSDMRTRFFRDPNANNGGGANNNGQAAAPAAPATDGGNPADNNRGAGQPPAAPAAPAAAPAQPAAPGNDGGQRAAAPATTQMDLTAALDVFRVAGISDDDMRRTLSEQAGGDINRLRALAMENMAQRANQQPQQPANRSAVQGGDNNRTAERTAMSDAILHRTHPDLLSTGLPETSRRYANMGLMDMARHCVEAAAQRDGRSIDVFSMSKREIAMMALNLSPDGTRQMSTSDFPQILGNTVNRILMARYTELATPWRQLGRQRNATDFRTITSVRLSELGKLDKVLEGGEYKRDAYTEVASTHRVEKFGRIICFTWEMIVNDDLNAFGDVLTDIASAAARTQTSVVMPLLFGGSGNNGATMYDGVQLFNSAHKNIGTPSAINISSMGELRKLIRQQKGIKGEERLNLTPTYFVVGPENEQLALQYTSSAYNPTVPGEINPWKNTVMPIVLPDIDDYDPNAFYFFASPNQIPTFVYSFLEGDGELFTEQRVGFDVDGLEIKARMVFGASVQDWRGMAKNAGAS